MPDNNWYQVNGYYYNPQWQQNWQGGQQAAAQQPHLNIEQMQELIALLGNAPPLGPPPVPAPDLAPEEGTMINDFKVGCDPVFLILPPQGGTDPAVKYFPHYGEIGYDHGARIAEFQRGPSKGKVPII